MTAEELISGNWWLVRAIYPVACDASINEVFESDEEMIECAKKKYEEAKKNGPERLCSCSDDFTLFLWEPLTSKQPVARLTGHQQLVNHMAFSPDGRYIASASFDKKVKVWDGVTGKYVLNE